MDVLAPFRKTSVQLMRVVTYGNPCLRERAAEIGEITDEIRDLAERMTVTMFENETTGIGLAAPQVGVGLRLVTLATHSPETMPTPDAFPGELLLAPRMPIALVNPRIVSVSEEREPSGEGCLSIPEIYEAVERPVSVVLRTRLLDGQEIEVECGGLLARCLQHEIDHLDGVLFVDHLPADVQRLVRPQLKAIEKRERRWLKRNRTSS